MAFITDMSSFEDSSPAKRKRHDISPVADVNVSKKAKCLVGSYVLDCNYSRVSVACPQLIGTLLKDVSGEIRRF